MRRTVSAEQFRTVLTALDSHFAVEFAGGAIRFLGRSLPANVVCAILPTARDGVLRVVYDPNKPGALAHTQAMLRDWWESYCEPTINADGTIGLAPRTCPEAYEGSVELTAAI